jgi:hypothetical protein
VCHHAGGPLTDGPIRDIEDLGLTVVSCPWHNFLVCIDNGVKVFQGVDIIDGKPTVLGWVSFSLFISHYMKQFIISLKQKTGKVVQRAHFVKEDEKYIYIVIFIFALCLLIAEFYVNSYYDRH